MSNLGFTYFRLGRYRVAAELQEKALEFHQRILPENHPDIGVMRLCFIDFMCDLTGYFLGGEMGHLANTYGELGRHQDAVALQEKALEFHRRILPENHPHIGVMPVCNVDVTCDCQT